MLLSRLVRYGKRVVSVLRWLPSVLLLLPWLLAPAMPSGTARIRDLASPNAFSLVDWETRQLAANAVPLWAGLFGSPTPTDGDIQALRAYFANPPDRGEQRSAAQTAMEHVVTRAYIEGGLSQIAPVSLGKLFPPVLVTLMPPPNVLVISPRTELRVIDSPVLQPMDVAAQEQLEASADSTGVSSLVAPIGGLATYPSMVLEQDSAQGVLASVAHEWMHQYLIFYPLGAGYWNNQETRDINETTAELIGQEVGTQIAASLGLSSAVPGRAPRPAPARSGFSFQTFMRDTRGETERLLRAGQVDEAEAYMRSRRDELQQHGYYIRKLNQAYFALYGSYGENAAASPTNPIPALLHKLRDESPTLADFVVKVREVKTIAELRAAAGG
jgi:hypothetical protein